MPPRAPAVYRDTPQAGGATTTAKPSHEDQRSQKRQKQSILKEKPNYKFASSSRVSKASPGKRKRKGAAVVDLKQLVKQKKWRVSAGQGRGVRADIENVGHDVGLPGMERSESSKGKVRKEAESVKKESPAPPVSLPEIPSNLYSRVLAYLSTEHPSCQPAFSSTSTPNDIAEAVTAHQLWSPQLLTLFRETDVEALTLQSSNRFFDPAPLLRSFFDKDTFLRLSRLSLSHLSLDGDSIANLRLLPALKSLDLSNTGIHNHALCNLVCHSPTLTELNLSNNPRINDDARVPLSALYALTHLYLRGTTFTMPGLYRLILDLEARPQPTHPFESAEPPPPPRPPCRLASIPAGCLDALNSPPGYAVQIPQEGNYVKDPRLVGDLDTRALKRNLELHAAVDKRIGLTGGKVAMVERLRGILERREGDARLRRAVLGP